VEEALKGIRRPPPVSALQVASPASPWREMYNVRTLAMEELRFEWDPAKAKRNLREHGVSFEEAESVFSDDFAILVADPDHSRDEDRFVLVGLSAGLRILVVVHCYRDQNVIRIISARRATPSERAQYAWRWKQ
jgi:uncharacterized protein